MKKVVFAVLLVMLTAQAVFAAGGKVAFVDTQAVFDKTKMGKKYQGILKEYYDSRKKILDLDADEIQKLRDDYTKQSSVLKPEARKEKEEQISRKINDFDKKRSEFNNELSKKNEDLSAEFNQGMIVILKDMAKKEKISLIMNKTINILQKGEIPAVLYGDDDLDLTEKVIAEMDKSFDAESKK
ncbi:MAG: OmpH family outer membrane protein [Nitrospiraceae bacterium]|nr:OmpH family outer membrane protein [Nitrospiraceae bacterium]